VEWDRVGFRRPILTVLATDLRGSTPFLEACTPGEARRFFWEFSSLTKEVVDWISQETGEPSRIDSFVGDGFLVFFAESPPDTADRTGPARVLVAAGHLRSQFRTLCADLFDGFGAPSRTAMRDLRLVSAITHGEVMFGPFGEPALPGNTGMLGTVVTAFRLTKLRWGSNDLDVATPPSRPETLDYIVVCDASLREIHNIVPGVQAGRRGTGAAQASASRARSLVTRELAPVSFRAYRRPLQGFGDVQFHEAIWPSSRPATIDL
jgi:hypothetical protein